MTITFDVAPDVEDRLQEQAAGSGLAVPDYVRRLVESSVRGPGERAAAIRATLDSFMAQDDAEHRDTLATLRTALDADRPGQRRVFGPGNNPDLADAP